MKKMQSGWRSCAGVPMNWRMGAVQGADDAMSPSGADGLDDDV
ncbi:hypothetical protein [Undibacterium sp.]|nr:hypothetical protein [Undibacterium sp.]HTD04002.1 hypothetical protein [Undibacterium sp.]